MILGKVDSVTADGVTLLIDGEDTPTSKAYQVVSSASSPEVGDKVAIEEINGSYMVMGVLGASGGGSGFNVKEYTIPSGTYRLDIQLEASKLYFVSYIEVYNSYSPLARFALVATQSASRSSYSTLVHVFAYTDNEAIFTGRSGFQLRVDKDVTTATAYVKVIEVI